MKPEKLEELKKEVRALLKERNAIMLAHNYQRDEIQEIADLTGDSLGLSQAAADSDAEVIVFCGVHFMLAPEKTVILPRMDAGCPMADMINAEQLAAEKAKHPEVPVVAYVNTTAEVKALTDICCTSGNAIKVTESVTNDEVYMVPDRNLAHYIARFSTKKISWWDGFCPTHENFTLEDALRAKAEHPDAVLICHPECRPDVVDVADHVCSTSGMYKYAKESTAKKFIIGTEIGILYKLRKENPGKEFIIPTKALICPNMKLTTLVDVRDSLRDMTNVVEVSAEIREKAKASLDAAAKFDR